MSAPIRTGRGLVRQRLSGVAFLLVIGLLLWLAIALYAKAFTPVVHLSLETDRAGNQDESPETRQFVMPYNLTQGKNWSRKKAKGYFAGDVLQTKRFGAELKFKAQLVTDILLLAPSGPSLGKIQVRVGDYRWKTIKLTSSSSRKQRRYVIRDEKSLFSGPVRIRSISRGTPVRVEPRSGW